MAGIDPLAAGGVGDGLESWDSLAEHPDWIRIPVVVETRRVGSSDGQPPSPGLAAWPERSGEGAHRAEDVSSIGPRTSAADRSPVARPGCWWPENDPVAAFLRVHAGLARLGLAKNFTDNGTQRQTSGEAARSVQAVSSKPHVAQSGRTSAAIASRAPNPNAALRTSASGRDFLFGEETHNIDYSAHTYWPEGASGVTIGAGYDMRDRTPDQIISDLTPVGVAPEAARSLSAAGRQPGEKHGLMAADAQHFANQHAEDVTLTKSQQLALFALILPDYEADVRRAVHVSLSQNEFDALVSFDYDVGGGNWPSVAAALNAGSRAEAANRLRHFSDLKDPALRERRRNEAALMLQPTATGSATDREPGH